MKDDAPQFTQNVSGAGNQNIQGMEISDVTQENKPEEPLTVQQVLTAVDGALPDDIQQEWMPIVTRIASRSVDEQNKPNVKEKIQAFVDKIKPHAGKIAKNLAIFGTAALESLAKNNPMIAGIVAVCKEHQA